MIDVIWSSTARNQYFEQLNYLYDHFGESTALKFQEKVFKIEDQLATGLVKYPASKQLGLEKCVLDKYNALIFQRDKEQIRIVLLINNRSDWDY
ncbi:plasmid stabilization system protein [Saprospira grandis DSM 2844]|uniref:Plasmid stabilization system protein n=1 Tax=Saprospira grandis DSM 2844 TaxID=694433 RepID=J0P3E3_9BACT|nr:type II toxin-antitoxin system RelE/ParE family toxin [Saprospira grandis]EJF54329.1 plasmid stabilization system protein [Saprospira grandis DSM 2844]